MAYSYGNRMDVMRKDPKLRTEREIVDLQYWFRKKFVLLTKITRETLLDVIQHCEFITKQKDDVVIYQGERGHTFYIVLRGSVSVLHKDTLDEPDLGEEGQKRDLDRSALGNWIVSLGEGATFGEIALINPDCIRTASVVADERTDLVAIRRDLYNRSVSKVVAKEYKEKIDFIDSHPLFKDWPRKLKRHLAACIKREVFPFESVVFKQGDRAEDMYFIVNGELKLVVDPEAHYTQFAGFMKKCTDVLDTHNDEDDHEKAYFPQKLLPQIQKYSRVKKATQLQRLGSSGGHLSQLPQSWSPSTIRKINAQIHANKVNLSLCYLGKQQYVGDVEFLLGLDIFHATATCNQETVVMVLNRRHFDRLFRRHTFKTIRAMSQMLELQLTRRAVKPNVLESVPLLKCFVYKLQQLLGEHKRTDDDNQIFSMPSVSFAKSRQSSSRPATRMTKSYSWSVIPRYDIQSHGGSESRLNRLLTNTSLDLSQRQNLACASQKLEVAENFSQHRSRTMPASQQKYAMA